MLINGIELSSLGVQLHNRVLTSNNIETTNDWLEGDIQPTFIRQQDKFKSMQLQFLITEVSEEAAFMVMSKLTMMLRKASIVFDDMNLIFDVTLDGKAQQERLKNGNFILTVNLQSDYAKGQAEIYTTDSRATDYFYLNVLYYMEGNVLLGSKKLLIKASQFDGVNDTFESIGVDVNAYRPDHYNDGNVTNFTGKELTYENLYNLQTLIVNYAPVVYSKEVEYFLESGGIYQPILTAIVTFTKKQVDSASTIGQVIDLTVNKPNGYRARTNFDLDFNFDNLMTFSKLEVYYDKIVNEQSKDVVVNYYLENDAGDFFIYETQTVPVREGNVVDGKRLSDIINVNAYKPEKYYDNGIIENHDLNALVSFEGLASVYDVKYKLSENLVLVEYYLGEYPNWSRITTNTYKIKYKTSFDSSSDIIKDTGIELNKYQTGVYEEGKIYNGSSIVDFDSLLNIGVLQVYYKPKDYTIKVSYAQDGVALGLQEYVINDYMFISNPTLAEIIDVNAMRPEGYIFSPELSYDGEVTLDALIAASPIIINYVPVAEIRTKSILVKYKQELSSAYSTINTSIITIEESSVGGGIKLSDLINLNAYKPEYYNDGIIDGASSSSMLLFDEIQGSYDVLYMATNYNTQVRYYTDTVENANWIGSNALQYRIIDFTTETTLIDLGLDVNAFKPSYCGDGQVQYTGPVTFQALINLDAINIVYEAIEEPEDPDGINYPHRILFLQHNDMGNYESQFPSWTLNHAYINTGVTVADMSKLTVLCDTFRVFDTEPLYNVNVNDAYLFGSITPQGSYYIKYVNNTNYKEDSLLTGINTFNVAAGYGTPELVVEETASEGFSANTGITASSRDGYSYATLTYTNLVQSNSAPMNVPLYLFACNQNGYYKGGIAGVGIKSCKIYYEDVLIRDFVPVAFYDKIGDKVAPSNCLYDKVTQTFFEDARGLNSFNIMDDPDHIDTDPEHLIGCCYVNYYKDETLFNTATIWFRGNDFIDQEFNPYEKFFVDYYQPQYYGSGEITNLAQIGDITFNNMQNQIFNVVYKSTGYNVVVNYWKDNKDNEENLLGTEVITLTEKDFYQVPTFGDLIPIQKYKPDGYVANYSYPESKVTLNRVMQYSPYDIIYTKVENPQVYETKITYLRKRYGIDIVNPEQTYENLGSVTLQLDETQFAEGVYIEDFIDMNAMYPVSPLEGKPFYHSGTPFEWYLKDEMLTSPESLKTEYKVSYEPVIQYIDVNYYTDVVEEENLIASTTWEIQINEWPDNGQFYIVDELPNTYIDKYKPVICGGGRIHEPEKAWTFETLVAAGEISIIYDTLDEPHDPESSMFPSKVIYFSAEGHDSVDWYNQYPYGLQEGNDDTVEGDKRYPGAYIPYLDLGYKPKEIGRLRIETKAYSLGNGMEVNASKYGAQTDTFLYFLGYYGGPDISTLNETIGTSDKAWQIAIDAMRTKEDGLASEWSPNSPGWFAFKGHIPQGGFFVYTNPYPQTVDGLSQFNLNTKTFNEFHNWERIRELTGGFRRGYYDTLGNNWEHINTYKDYVYNDYSEDIIPQEYYIPLVDSAVKVKKYPEDTNKLWWSSMYGSSIVDKSYKPAIAFNPITMTVDAYNNYMESYDYTNSNNPYYVNINNEDIDIFTRRCQPKGTISAFATTNPNNGEINLNPFDNTTYPALGMGLVGGGAALGSISLGNPWAGDFTGTVAINTQVITGTMDDGTPIYTNTTIYRNINYAKEIYSVYPCQLRTMIWYIKIWDRNKLVRNLIPVAEGDQIYDYIMPANGMFDLVTETFYSNQNEGGDYAQPRYKGGKFIGMDYLTVSPDEVYKLEVANDPTVWGNIVVNYYDEDNNFLGNQYVEIPVHYNEANSTIYEICHHNDFKPGEFYHDGMIDVDIDLTKPTDDTLKQIYDKGSINVYYKLMTFAKTVVYYQGNTRVGSKDLFYSIEDIDNAETLADLGIDVNLYASDDFAPGRIMFNEKVIADDDIKTFIDASSPVVVYDKLSKEEAPNLLYVEYYRGGAYDDTLITLDEEDPNYLNCDLDAVVLNPHGSIKYLNHYHSALFEDEKQDYFIAYQVDVKANYVPVHKGPARRYATLAIIVDKGRYTILEEKEGWGRLKEYPNGWIMLSYTEPTTGPGQNPAYDENNKAQVTIPFATRLTITKMTVDRLWCYSPEYASWIKAEEISFDQSGKLYNALAMKVIHLDEIDWSTISSLNDLGIYTQAYKLKYHDNSNYVYEGNYDYNSFSELHNIEIVYPETIYAYNCIYYSDIKSADTELGRISFSCSMSDWNPDWDTFIETSWRVDENGDAINPILYRDTELTLTWDFFGIDKNLYKPSEGNYNDGIFLWNPRTYENKDIYFTFEELVTTGVQEILYLPTLNSYKARYNMNWTILPANIDAFSFAPKAAGPGLWDIEVKYQRLDGKPYERLADWSNIQGGSGKVEAINTLINGNNRLINGNGTNGQGNLALRAYVYKRSGNLDLTSAYLSAPYTTSSSDKYSYYNTINFSNKRNASIIHSHGDDLTQFMSNYKIRYVENGVNLDEDIPADRTLDMQQDKYYRFGAFDEYQMSEDTDSITYYDISNEEIPTIRIGSGAIVETSASGYKHYNGFYHMYDTIFYHVKIWKNYYLEHYYVPLPKGTWLADGRQIPYNTFYDVITNTICEAYNYKPGSATYPLTYPHIYNIGKKPEGESFDYFDKWDYNTIDCNYIVKTTAQINGYKDPDVLAIQLATYPANTVMPVTKYTADAENRVQGEWYFNGYAWFQTTNTTILPSDSYTITNIVDTAAIKGDTRNTVKTYNAYLAPEESAASSATTFTSETVTSLYAESGDFYWTGKNWIPKTYTSKTTNEINKKYVVSVDYLTLYKYPVASDVYKVQQLQSGDRLVGTGELYKDTEWKFVNVSGVTGWVDGYNTIAEIIE